MSHIETTKTVFSITPTTAPATSHRALGPGCDDTGRDQGGIGVDGRPGPWAGQSWWWCRKGRNSSFELLDEIIRGIPLLFQDHIDKRQTRFFHPTNHCPCHQPPPFRPGVRGQWLGARRDWGGWAARSMGKPELAVVSKRAKFKF